MHRNWHNTRNSSRYWNKLILQELEYDLVSVKSAYFTLSFRPIFPHKPKAVTYYSMYENTFPSNSMKNYSYSNSNVDVLSYQDPRLLATSYMMYKIGKLVYLLNSKYFSIEICHFYGFYEFFFIFFRWGFQTILFSVFHTSRRCGELSIISGEISF